MGLQNRESSYIQAVSARWDIALPQNMEAVSVGGSSFEEAALYLDDADTLTITTSGGQTLTVPFAAGFLPVRVTAVSAQAGTANVWRVW